MKKRGWMLIFFACFLVASVHAESLNISTQGSGFLYLTVPDNAGVGEEFSISGTYYFLNQLLTDASITVVKGDVVLKQEVFDQEESVAFFLSLSEETEGVHAFDVVIRETNQNNLTYETRQSFAVLVGEVKITDENVIVKKGIVKGSIDQAFDDLASRVGTIEAVQFKLVESGADVACAVPDTVILFTPREDFSGEAECVVKATQGSVTKLITYKILVGSSTQVAKWEEVLKKTLPQDSSTEFVVAGDATDKAIAFLDPLTGGDLLSVDITTSPDPAMEGEIGVVRLRVQALSDTVISIALLEMDIEGEVFSKEDCSRDCALDITYKFSKSGGLALFPRISFLTSVNGNIAQGTYGGGWVAGWDGEDIVLTNIESIVYVRPKVDDIGIPSLGVVTDPERAEERATASAILQEYQRKNRLTMNLDEELERIKNFAKYVDVKKTLETVERIDVNGDRSMHTVYTVMFATKEMTTWQKIVDFLLGKRRFMDMKVFEHIAKDAAVDLGHVKFMTQGYEVVLEDPLVVWHFDELSDDPIAYEVDKETDSRGNTVVSGDVKRGFPNIVFAVFLLPIVIVIVVYFDRFKKHPKEDADDRVPDYQELEDENYHPKAAPIPADEMPPETVQNINDFDRLIEAVEAYIKHRVQEGHSDEDIKKDLLNANWPMDMIVKLLEKHRH